MRFAILAVFISIALPCFPQGDQSPCIVFGSLETVPGEASLQISISRFRYYISHLRLWKDSTCIWQEKDGYHLVDGRKGKTLSIPPGLDFDSLSFMVGIDSLTNVAGVLGGDLDPLNGMYWAWQSGYINLMLEGTREEQGSRKPFAYHLGGYSSPFLSCRETGFRVAGSIIHIVPDPYPFLLLAMERGIVKVMSPGPEAVKLSDEAIKMFCVREAN